MIVSIILVVFPGCIRLGGIIACSTGAAPWGNACGQNRCSGIEVEHNIAFQVNGVGSVRARGKPNRAPSLAACRLDGLIDRRSINRGAVASCAIASHIDDRICAYPGHGCSLRLSAG